MQEEIKNLDKAVEVEGNREFELILVQNENVINFWKVEYKQ